MTAADAIREKIAELEKGIDSLRTALTFLEGSKDAGTPAPKVEAPRPAGTGAGVRSGSKKERALKLLLNGPLTTAELAKKLGDERSGNTAAVLKTQEHLFKRTGNMLSPWTLTAEGIETAKNL